MDLSFGPSYAHLQVLRGVCIAMLMRPAAVDRPDHMDARGPIRTDESFYCHAVSQDSDFLNHHCIPVSRLSTTGEHAAWSLASVLGMLQR
jgi:hypothetical protein